MNSRVRQLIAPVAVMAVLALAPPVAASPTEVLRACLNEQSLNGYSDADKRAALDQLAADQDEYSNCRAVIGASIGGEKGGKATPGSADPSGSGAASKDPARARRLAARQQKVHAARINRARKARERKLGRRAVDPRDPGAFKAASTANGAPLPVWLAVIALGLTALVAGALALSRRDPRVAALLRRVSLPRFRR